MAVLADFLDDLIGGCGVVVWALAVGGIVWALAVLRGWRRLPEPVAEAHATCLAVVVAAAIGIDVATASQVAIKAWILGETLGRSPFPAFLRTPFFVARLVEALAAAALAVTTGWLRRAPASLVRWAAVGVAVAALVVDGGWLAHAASRLERRGPLMAITVAHELGAAAWAGGIAQLVVLWRLGRRRPELAALWPVVLRRFSWVALPAVGLIAASGGALGWVYIGSWRGLAGTPYGALVVTKIALLAGVVTLGALNFGIARRWARGRSAEEVRTRVPYYVEAEGLVLFALLLAAAALSSQPPAVDMGSQVAAPAEVARVFAPKWPRLVSPSADLVLAGQPDALAAPGTPSPGDAWAEFNHDIAGIILVAVALVALAARRGVRLARHWPLGLAGLGVFLLFRNDPEAWPLGPMGFWESLKDGGILQHRLAVLLACVLGLVEWRARSPRGAHTRLPYLFPVLAFVGGVLLLTHSHSAFEVKSDYLVQISHTALGLLAMVVACGRLLELRLAPAGRLPGLAAAVAMLLIGVILTFYREPDVADAIAALAARFTS
jgi:copper resistance protein D